MRLRTPEEITAQLQARYDAIKDEVESPAMVYPCATCRWSAGAWCHNALVAGLSVRAFNWDAGVSIKPKLCGPEKALWEPIEQKPSWRERFILWIGPILFGPMT